VFSGLAAGAYPAFYLSRFKPSAVLRGTTLFQHSSRMRQLLVVCQFAILIGLLAATFTVDRQTRYAIEDRLRLPTDQIYLGSSGCPAAMLDEAATLEGVKGASCVSSAALGLDHFTAVFAPSQGRNLVAASAAPVDHAFFDVFDIKPVAGRVLSAKYGQDDLLRRDSSTLENPSLVINESAARALGYASPSDAVGKFHRWQRLSFAQGEWQQLDAASSEIVGVIPDFSIGSVRDAIAPTAYYVDPGRFYHLVLRFDGGAVPQALESVRNLWKQQPSAGRFDGTFLDQFVNDLYEDIVTQATIFSLFSGVAVVLAALGLLGLAIFTAERRTKEIGLRKVMGARRADILVFLGWQFARPVLWANLIAWPCTYLVIRHWLQGFAYHVDVGLATFVIAGTLALVIALTTVAGHAFLVARARPVEALRYE
jgi:putative ABC transport system permease protein